MKTGYYFSGQYKKAQEKIAEHTPDDPDADLR